MPPCPHTLDKAVQLIWQAHHLVALTGAGVSTASGIPDFRSAACGLWVGQDPLVVASLTAFRQTPALFFDWVRPLVSAIHNAVPNNAHAAFTQLNNLDAIITQNIDGLHTLAGSPIVYEIHGHLRTATCSHCFQKYDAAPLIVDLLATNDIPICTCGGVIKPDVILFEEQLPIEVVKHARQAVLSTDLLLVAGSSLSVHPANELPYVAKRRGARLVIINNTPTSADRHADVVLHGDVTEILPEIVRCLDETR